MRGNEIAAVQPSQRSIQRGYISYFSSHLTAENSKECIPLFKELVDALNPLQIYLFSIQIALHKKRFPRSFRITIVSQYIYIHDKYTCKRLYAMRKVLLSI